MLTILLIACGIAFLIVIYLVVFGFVAQKIAVKRRVFRDENFNPETDDAETFPATGDSPFRVYARDYNVWWNSMPLERHEITSHDGLRLVGHLLRAEKPSDRLAFVIHGHRCVSGEMGFIAKMYYDRGYHVFAPDQRAHGKSDGAYIGMGGYEHLDMLRWLEVLNGLLESRCKIVLHGISMGAATVMTLSGEAALPDNVICGIEDCGYTDAYGSIYHHIEQGMRWVPLKRAVTSAASVVNKIKAGYYFREVDCIASLMRTSLPMLFIHGTHDPVVPFWMLKELCDAHGGQKEILIVDGAPHGICFFWDTAEYTEKSFKFIERQMA